MVYRYLSRIIRLPIQVSKLVTTQQNHLFGSSIAHTMEHIKTLKELGYDFNAAWQLRKLGPDGEVTDEPFQFNISDNHQKCQAHYEELGNAVTPYVYNLLESEVKLAKLPVPLEAAVGDGTFIFVSEDYDDKEVLLILIHGTGVVRAGQWARSLIINESLHHGTQIPYIFKGLSKGYGIVVLNTNDNYLPDGRKIPKSDTPEAHAKYVWETYIAKTKAEKILIVAHSYGGVVTLGLASQFEKDFEKRVKAIAFTDSVHAYSNIKITPYFKEVAKNWISSPEPLDTVMKSPDFDIPRVSAGHSKHEMTSASCIDSVFKYFDEKLS